MSQVGAFNLNFESFDRSDFKYQVTCEFTNCVEKQLLKDGICLKEICGKIDALYWRNTFYSTHIDLWLDHPEYSRSQVRKFARWNALKSAIFSVSCYDSYLDLICNEAQRLIDYLWDCKSFGNDYLKSLCIRACIGYSMYLSNELKGRVQNNSRMVRLNSQALFHLKGLRRLVGVNLIKGNPDQYSDPDGQFWESYVQIFDNLRTAIMIERNEQGPDDF